MKRSYSLLSLIAALSGGLSFNTSAREVPSLPAPSSGGTFTQPKRTPRNSGRCSRDIFGKLHRHPITAANVNTDPVHMHSKARQRHFAAEDQATAELAAKAVGGAL
jgi:hypothetical protein